MAFWALPEHLLDQRLLPTTLAELLSRGVGPVFNFFLLSEGVLHPGAGCSGAEGKIQCLWKKLLDFAWDN